MFAAISSQCHAKILQGIKHRNMAISFDSIIQLQWNEGDVYRYANDYDIVAVDQTQHAI
jgi:hypothetical protein